MKTLRSKNQEQGPTLVLLFPYNVFLKFRTLMIVEIKTRIKFVTSTDLSSYQEEEEKPPVEPETPKEDDKPKKKGKKKKKAKE